jgi:hypothetical protein
MRPRHIQKEQRKILRADLNVVGIPQLRRGADSPALVNHPIYWRMKPDLTDEETEAIARLLRDTIDADHSPLSQRVQIWKGILAKIRPEQPQASLDPKGPGRNPNRCRL